MGQMGHVSPHAHSPHSWGSHLAPRRVLCVVLVTTSACSKGDGITLAATSPLMWAMSASRYALTSSHTWGHPWSLAGPRPPSPGPRPLPTYLLDAGVVDEPGVGAGARDDEPGTEEPRCHLQLGVVDQSCGGLGGTDRQVSEPRDRQTGQSVQG